MMKTILLAALLLCTITAIDSCSSSSPSTTTPTPGSTAYPYMIGKIEVIGNEPFTKLALRVDESHVFLLRASKEVEQDLVRHQQGLVRLYYSGRQEKAKDHYLDVDHVEKLVEKK